MLTQYINIYKFFIASVKKIGEKLMDAKKFNPQSKRLILEVTLVILVIAFAAFSLNSIFATQKAIGYNIRSICSMITTSAEQLEAADSESQKQEIVDELSLSIKKTNNSLKSLTQNSPLFKSYNMNEVWKYVSTARAEGIDSAESMIMSLAAIIDENGLLDDSYEAESYMYSTDPKNVKEKISNIVTYADGVISSQDI
jgi:hypothetical protein